MDSVLLKPLGFHESSRLVACWERVRFLRDDALAPNPRHVEVWRRRATAFRGLTYLRQMAMGLTLGAEHPRQTSAVVTIPNFFDILQVLRCWAARSSRRMASRAMTTSPFYLSAVAGPV